MNKIQKEQITSIYSMLYASASLAFWEQNPRVTILSWFREVCRSEGCIIIEDLELF